MKIPKLNVENIVLALIVISFFIGTWHAFPMLNVVGDEMYYVGGVLRAMEAHTIVPQAQDVPYGTLLYLLSYVMHFIVLSVYLLFFKFSVSDLKVFLIENPETMYFFLRILNSLLATVILLFVNKLLKKEFEDKKTRLFLLILLFSNIIVTLILHTGKMWVLSTLLVIISFYYLHQTLTLKSGGDKRKIYESAFLSIIFSFLALSNFPLNIYSLMSLPVLIFYFKGDRESLYKIIKYIAAGFSIYIVVTLFNFEGIRGQIISVFTEYHHSAGSLTNSLSDIGNSIISYCLKFLSLFPLLLITLAISLRNKIKDKNLFVISCVYLISYFLLISFVANWTGSIRDYLRYLMPMAFFLLFMVASFELRWSKIFYVIGFVSVFFQATILYKLAVPTTYNQAFTWIDQNLADESVLIVNNIGELQLTKNKDSSLLTRKELCFTKCTNIIALDLHKEFEPLVVDLLSKEVDLSEYKQEAYYIMQDPSNDPKMEELKAFENDSKFYHSVDYNIGSYFDIDLIKIKNFGRNIYIYKKSK